MPFDLDACGFLLLSYAESILKDNGKATEYMYFTIYFFFS